MDSNGSGMVAEIEFIGAPDPAFELVLSGNTPAKRPAAIFILRSFSSLMSSSSSACWIELPGIPPMAPNVDMSSVYVLL